MRLTHSENGFDMMMAGVIVLFQSFGEREFLCVQSPVTITKICSEAEMGEVLHDHLTETHQINYVVLVNERRENC